MLHLKIITPKKIILEDEVDSVTAPTADGEITVLSHHENLFSMLSEGIIKIKKKDHEQLYAAGGGYIETDGEDIRILVSRAYHQNEIDEELTQRAIAEAGEILKKSQDQKERIEASALLRHSLIDMKLLKRRKRHV